MRTMHDHNSWYKSNYSASQGSCVEIAEGREVESDRLWSATSS